MYLAYGPGSRGTYQLVDGELSVRELTIGRIGQGDFQQFGGRNSIASGLTLGTTFVNGRGDYRLMGGELIVQDVERIRHGEFYQSGGRHEIGRLTVSGTGSFRIDGGSFRIGQPLPTPSGDMYVQGQFEQFGAMTETRLFGSLRIDGTASMNGGFLLTSDGINVSHESSELQLVGGTMSTPFIVNRGQFLWTDGELLNDTIGTDFTNAGVADFDLPTARLIPLGTVVNTGEMNFYSSGLLQTTGPLTNYGTMKLHPGVDLYLDVPEMSLHGTLELDPATFRIGGDLIVEENGRLVGGSEDRFVIEADFLNRSQQQAGWDTTNAALILAGDGRQIMELPGNDGGDVASAAVENFAWGMLEISAGVLVEIRDGNPLNEGTALYVDALSILDLDQIDFVDRRVLNISGDGIIYYDPLDPNNEYLGGLPFAFASSTLR